MDLRVIGTAPTDGVSRVGADRDTPARAHDADAFDSFVEEHQAALVRYATLLAGSVPQGEDIVQDVLVRLYPRWDDIAEPHSYVRRCVTNEFLSWRRRWSTRHIHVMPDVALERPFDQDWGDGPDPELWAQLQQLPRQQRAAVVLRYWEGLDDAEIGALLGCKSATARGYVSRGLSTLRDALVAPTSGDRR